MFRLASKFDSSRFPDRSVGKVRKLDRDLLHEHLEQATYPRHEGATLPLLQDSGVLGRVWADTGASLVYLAELPRIRSSGDDGATVLGKQPRSSSFPQRK